MIMIIESRRAVVNTFPFEGASGLYLSEWFSSHFQLITTSLGPVQRYKRRFDGMPSFPISGMVSSWLGEIVRRKNDFDGFTLSSASSEMNIGDLISMKRNEQTKYEDAALCLYSRRKLTEIWARGVEISWRGAEMSVMPFQLWLINTAGDRRRGAFTYPRYTMQACLLILFPGLHQSAMPIF